MLKKLRAKREAHNNHPTAFDDAVLSWIAPETLKHERGMVWKVSVGLLLVGAVVYGILSNAWTFSLVLVVFAIVYYITHREHPKDVEVKISDVGLKVGDRKYPYGRIKAFWFIYEPPYVSTLNIRVEGGLVDDVVIQLGTQNPMEAKAVLSKHLTELEGQTEKLSDIFFRLFKI